MRRRIDGIILTEETKPRGYAAPLHENLRAQAPLLAKGGGGAAAHANPRRARPAAEKPLRNHWTEFAAYQFAIGWSALFSREALVPADPGGLAKVTWN